MTCNSNIKGFFILVHLFHKLKKDYEGFIQSFLLYCLENSQYFIEEGMEDDEQTNRRSCTAFQNKS